MMIAINQKFRWHREVTATPASRFGHPLSVPMIPEEDAVIPALSSGVELLLPIS